MFQRLLQGHPDLFNEIKELSMITDKDMEHIAKESIPVCIYLN